MLHVENQNEVIREVLNWPQAATSNPVNEFRQIGYITQAFPHLFPTGKADFNDNTRTIKVTFREWVKHLINQSDLRFAQDPRFRYFCLNTMQRHDACTRGVVFANISHFTGTVNDLLHEVNTNPSAIKRLMHIGSGISGTGPYWYKRRTELEAMVLQLGVPTFFLTLSAADLWWPCLVRHFGYDTTGKNETQISKDMQKLLSLNPLIANEYFAARVEVFLKLVCSKFNVNDYWYRVEYQHRGSPHIHGLFWIENAPDVREFHSMSQPQLVEVKKFYDNLVSAWNPDPKCEPAQKHPARLFGSEIGMNDDKQLAQLLNRFQRHTCSQAYCVRGSGADAKCRFKYPKDIQVESRLEADERGVFVYTPKRNDKLLNIYNPFVSKLWRANSDFQVIASEHAIITYITKYASKSEPKSEDLKDVFRHIATTLNANDPASKAITKLLMKILSQRDISACETMHIINEEGLYHCTRTFVSLYICKDQYGILSRDEDQAGEALKMSKILESYKVRPAEYEGLSLFDFAKTLTPIGRQHPYTYRKNRKHRIVQILPNMKPALSEDSDEIYYKRKLVCRQPWRDFNALKTHSTWKESFNASAIDLWELPEPDPLDNEEEDDVAIEVESDPHQWMMVAQAMPGAPVESVPLGYREIDRNFDWSDGKTRYPDIESKRNFIKHSKENDESNPRVFNNLVNLNEQQLSVVNFAVQASSGNTVDRLAIVLGAAGTGKSCVINEIFHRIGAENVLLLAFTGVAAHNISGQTIHSALHLTCNRGSSELSPDALHKFQEEMSSIKVILIDEFSMIGLKLLGRIDARLRVAKPENSPLGGFVVIWRSESTTTCCRYSSLYELQRK